MGEGAPGNTGTETTSRFFLPLACEAKMDKAQFGEEQKYGKIEAPALPVVPDPHPEKIRRAELDQQVYIDQVKMIRELQSLIDEPDLDEAFTLNFYEPSGDNPKSIAEAVAGLYPEIQNPHWSGFVFMGQLEGTINRIKRYLKRYRAKEESIVGQETVQKLVAVEDRVGALEKRLEALEGKVEGMI